MKKNISTGIAFLTVFCLGYYAAKTYREDIQALAKVVKSKITTALFSSKESTTVNEGEEPSVEEK